MVLGEGEWEKFGITGRLTTPDREIIHSTVNILGQKLHKNSLKHQEFSKQKLDEIIATLEYTAQKSLRCLGIPKSSALTATELSKQQPLTTTVNELRPHHPSKKKEYLLTESFIVE